MVGENCYRISGPEPTTRSLPGYMINHIESIREDAIVHMDIAIYKCIAHERMEKIKNETYGKQKRNKNNRTIDWKMSISMILSTFV